MLEVLASGIRRRHFLYGGREGIAQELAERIRHRSPTQTVVGTMTPPFAPIEQLATSEVANAINSVEPDIVWVGMSTPKQELWMAAMRHLLSAPLLVGVGAAFDFHAGRVRQAPTWMQRAGLEWLFRLSQEPRRLWRRYLLDNPQFVFQIARQRLGLKKYEI